MKHIKRIVVRSLLATVVAVLTVEVIPYGINYLIQRHIGATWAAYYAAHVGTDLARESDAVTHGVDDDGLPVPDDYHGTFVNVDNGVRRTMFQPEHPIHTVWMFGNSALYGYYVSDADTIASKLQALMPADKVVNLAFPMYDIPMQTVALERTAVAPGDTVIFYDGAYDILLSFYPPFPCESNVGLIALGCQWIPPRFDAADFARRRVRIGQAIHDAWTYTEAHGGAFLHFWQPIIFSHDLTPAEQTLMDDFNTSTGHHQLACTCWLIDPPDGTISLFHILEGQPDSYTDWIHTTRAANAVIAGAIRVRVGA